MRTSSQTRLRWRTTFEPSIPISLSNKTATTLSSVIREPCYLCSSFFCWTFSICSVGPFFAALHRLWRFVAFLLGLRGAREREGDHATSPYPSGRPVLGPSVHLGAMRCRTTGNKVPRTTWFLWLSRKWILILGEGISRSTRPTIMLQWIL